MPSETFCFLEQTDFSVRFARCASSIRPLRIEELIEVGLAEMPALVAKVDPAAIAVCALRPKPTHVRLTTVDEAKRFAGGAGVRAFAAQPALASTSPAWLAAVQASDGSAPASSPWLVAAASAEAHAASLSAFAGLNVKSKRNVAATFTMIGAIAATASKPILVLEIGELVSHAILVAREGVIGVQALSLNLDQIAGAVQAELNLKFRGSAAKLFFNADYDFTDTAAKVVGRLVETLKADLAPLFTGRTPAALYCAGLPISQTWFGPQLSAALNLPLHTPDLKAWSDSARIAFASPELSANVSPAWLGLLHLVSTSVPVPAAGAAWQGEWFDLTSVAAAPAVVAAPVAPAPVPAVVPTPAAPVAAPKSAPTPVPAIQPVPTPVAKPVIAPPAAAPAPAAKAATAPAAKPAPVAAPAPQKQAAPSSVSYNAKPTTPDKSAAKPVQKKGPEPVAAKAAPAPAPASSSASATAPAAAAAKPVRKSHVPLIGGLVAVVVLMLVGFFFYNQRQESARLLAEKQRTEQRLHAEEEKARIAQQAAEKEAESRKLIEATAAEKLAQSEAAREQAVNEARAQAAARLANARGTLLVTTEPAGATVKVGDLPPRTSPATFTDIKIGKYPVAISLARHATANVELEVRENATTQAPVITLERVFGTLELTSGANGADYELHPAKALMVAAESRRTGKTPATIADLPPDDYAVTFTREGWAPHTETVSVTRGAVARLEWIFPNGAVHLTSTPDGATVVRNGTKLGVTPLLLADQVPGDARYQLVLDGFDPITLDGKIVGSSKLELSAQFPLADRFYDVSEVDRKPDASSTPKPELPYYLTIESGRVEMEVVVTRDGTTKNVRVVSATNPDFGKYCTAALAKWKFKPGVKDGQPVNVKLTVPFVFTKGRL